ncbi:mannose-6-phosphate isomerase, class I [Agrococcus jejuensis]|uniref:mannose-6-phosphate isomerase n=1 Tax=Agrococcus jejuensis TaxID=399736 RepID=A0A1G8FJ25_9MICO|nr:mannose-6-phosphate isomerase, class I [Agrococcus jejuensis]SDH82134.1 mannose-6-phosphate isomerase, type 1 [Agrococcus jejuensis]
MSDGTSPVGLARIANAVRDYAWGSETLVAEYLGTEPSGGPEAEVWLGAHPAWPARLDDGTPLDAALAAAGATQPGILLKVLAAAHALSLQVHPSPAQARAGFAAEEAAGVPLDASHRSYKDPRSKPELIVAVTPFEALSGFQPAARTLAVLDALAAIDVRVAPYAERVRASTREALAWLLTGGDDVDAVVAGVVAAAPSLPAEHAAAADTVARLHADYPGDAGIATALMLHRVSLAPGEGVFLPAGNLHAYLSGLGIELMEASDNVLRGGLTPKHVDRDELLRIVDVTPVDDPMLHPIALSGATAYRPDAAFELRHVEGSHTADGAACAIVLAASPTVVEVAGERLALARGEAAFAAAPASIRVDAPDAWLALEVRDTP